MSVVGLTGWQVSLAGWGGVKDVSEFFSPLPNAEPRAEFHFLTKHPNAKDMAFVGLTERWDESVCLFHRMLPGIVE